MLAICESNYTSNAYVEDDGGSESIGVLQFKRETFERQSKYYGFQSLDIWNPEHQKLVAWHMIADLKFGHWFLCSQQLGFLP